jgi:hypothetical protein
MKERMGEMRGKRTERRTKGKKEGGQKKKGQMEERRGSI